MYCKIALISNYINFYYIFSRLILHLNVLLSNLLYTYTYVFTMFIYYTNVINKQLSIYLYNCYISYFFRVIYMIIRN